jgi:hypothetical protein
VNRIRTYALLLSCLVVTTDRVAAETLNLVASADSRVDALQPSTAFPTGSLLAAKEGAPETQATQLSFTYAQFQLPVGLTGQDIGSVNSVDFTVFQNGPDFSLTYYVYGVLDGQDSASADTYTWNQGVGFDPSHTLVKFLGPDEISYYSDPAKSVFVGTFDTGNPGPGPNSFSGVPQSPTAAAALKNLILNDTDGRITLYIGSRANFGVTGSNTFASLETANVAPVAPPTLTLNFQRIPEPGTALLGVTALAAPAILRKRRS